MDRSRQPAEGPRSQPDGRILQGPAARAALLRGATQMARLLRPTLGPTARTVAIAPLVGGGPPEVLDSAATIARRTIRLADHFENAGAMLVRHAVWRTFEAVGDGGATTAVLLHRLLAETARLAAAGYEPHALDRGIAGGLTVARETLARTARPLTEPSELAALAASALRDPRLAELIAEVIETVGPEGALLIEDALDAETSYAYLDGVRWNEGYLSAAFLPPGATMVRLTDPRILLTDYPLERAEQLVPALEACVAAGERRLLVVAPELRDAALALLLVNRDRGVLEQVVAVRAPSVGAQQTGILEDLAALTGGRCFRREAFDRFDDLRLADLGSARHAWATRHAFGILGGRGAKEAIRARARAVRAELDRADDESARKRIRERIGKLTGAAAIVQVGAATQRAQEELKARIEAAAAATRAALAEGAVAGGGAALVGCTPALDRLAAGLPGPEALGVRALRAALLEPLRAIVENAGLSAAPIVHAALERGPGWTFDVLRRAWVDPWTAGIVDPLPVVRTALETSVSVARTALKAEVVVHRIWPAVDARP